MLKKLRRWLAPLFWVWLGGALHITAFYAAWLAVNPQCHIHWFCIENIIFWPWYCGLMVYTCCF